MTEAVDGDLMPCLFWSNTGEIACERHAPPSGGTRWLEERWGPIEVTRGAGIDYRCQHCRREEFERRDR